jgi:hypothetical protein
MDETKLRLTGEKSSWEPGKMLYTSENKKFNILNLSQVRSSEITEELIDYIKLNKPYIIERSLDRSAVFAFLKHVKKISPKTRIIISVHFPSDYRAEYGCDNCNALGGKSCTSCMK